MWFPWTAFHHHSGEQHVSISGRGVQNDSHLPLGIKFVHDELHDGAFDKEMGISQFLGILANERRTEAVDGVGAPALCSILPDF